MKTKTQGLTVMQLKLKFFVVSHENAHMDVQYLLDHPRTRHLAWYTFYTSKNAFKF